MDRHPVVLKQRVHPQAVGPGAGEALGERVRREGHHHAEEQGDDHQGGQNVGLKLEVAPVEPPHADADVPAEEKEPPQDRTVLASPQGGEEVHRRHGPVGVRRDVPEAEVVRDEGVCQAQDGDADEAHGPVGTKAGGLQRSRSTAGTGREGYGERVAGGQHDRQHSDASEQG